MIDIRYILDVLLPYIILLYLIDCLTYIRPGHVLFVSNLGKNFSIKKAGIRFIGISPLVQIIISRDFPLFFSKRGIYVLTSEYYSEHLPYKMDDFTFLEYHDINSIEDDGNNIKINNICIKTPSSIQVKNIINSISNLKNMHIAERASKINQLLNDEADISQFKQFRTVHSKHYIYLMLFCSYLFVLMCIIMPLTIYTQLYLYINIMFLSFHIIIVYFLVLIMAFIIHRSILKDYTENRILTLIQLILLPVSIIHVLKYLERDSYSGFNHFTIAAALLPLHNFKALIKKELNRIVHSKSQGNSADFMEIMDLKERALHKLIKKLGMHLQDVLAPPSKLGLSATSYCPLCETEYVFGTTICQECNIKLKPF